MEVDVDQIAERFDRYPNFAVDTAARIPYLMRQSPEKVRAFLIKYQDRVLYGTDLVLITPDDKAATALEEWATTYARDWKYFATGEDVRYERRNDAGTGPACRRLSASCITTTPCSGSRASSSSDSAFAIALRVSRDRDLTHYSVRSASSGEIRLARTAGHELRRPASSRPAPPRQTS